MKKELIFITQSKIHFYETAYREGKAHNIGRKAAANKINGATVESLMYALNICF
jgi:hypothetical protein